MTGTSVFHVSSLIENHATGLPVASDIRSGHSLIGRTSTREQELMRAQTPQLLAALVQQFLEVSSKPVEAVASRHPFCQESPRHWIFDRMQLAKAGLEEEGYLAGKQQLKWDKSKSLVEICEAVSARGQDQDAVFLLSRCK
jgi:hypothetical protein